MHTIKDLSETLNISKVSLYKMLKNEKFKPYVSKKDGVTVIDDTGAALIRAHYSDERTEALNHAANQDLQVKNTDFIMHLQEQLKEKDSQIKSLLTILENEQKLKATDKIPLISSSAEPPEGAAGRKPIGRFFSKIFGKSE